MGERCLPDELRTLFLFERLSDEQLATLCADGHIASYEPGPICGEGDPATCFYVLIEGELVVRNTLVIHSTGRVLGKISYGRIEIARGGIISGQIDVLPEAGIKGNGHTLMLEKNNKQIMFRMIAWLEGHVFNRK